MASVHEIMVASTKIGDLMYQVGVQNGHVVSEDPNQNISIVFNSMVFGLSKAIAVACCGGRGLDQVEAGNLMLKVQKEVLAAAQKVLLDNAGEGFKLLVVGR